MYVMDSFIGPEEKAHIFSLKLIHWTLTLINTDNRKFSISRVTNLIFRQPPFKDIVYLCSTYDRVSYNVPILYGYL